MTFFEAVKSIPSWAVDLLWIFKNASKARKAIDSIYSTAPVCPCPSSPVMVFESEQPYVEAGKRDKSVFQRNYKCPLCEYRTYTIYTAKRVE